MSNVTPFVPRHGVVLNHQEVVACHTGLETSLIFVEAIISSGLINDFSVFREYKDDVRFATQVVLAMRHDMEMAKDDLGDVIDEFLDD